MNEPTVTLDQSNDYLWQRQGFDLTRRWTDQLALTAPAGLYGTGPTLYPSLLARYADFHFDDLKDALYERRSLVRMRAMRVSVFAVPLPILPVVFQATRRLPQQAFDQFLAQAGVSTADYTRIADRICQLLETRGLTVAEVKKAIAPLNAQVQGGLKLILSRMCAAGQLACGRVRGGWKSDLCEYTLFENWLPDANLSAVDPEEARVTLAHLYFKAYGPATFEDFRWWSGLARSDADQALSGVKKLFALVEIRNLPGEYYLLKEDLERLRAAKAKAPPGVSLLPVWDPYLMAYRERTRYLAEEWYGRVFDTAGNGTSTVLLGGRIASVWDIEENGDTFTLKVALFEPADPEVWRVLRQAAQRLAGEVRAGGFASSASCAAYPRRPSPVPPKTNSTDPRSGSVGNVHPLNPPPRLPIPTEVCNLLVGTNEQLTKFRRRE